MRAMWLGMGLRRGGWRRYHDIDDHEFLYLENLFLGSISWFGL